MQVRCQKNLDRSIRQNAAADISSIKYDRARTRFLPLHFGKMGANAGNGGYSRNIFRYLRRTDGVGDINIIAEDVAVALGLFSYDHDDDIKLAQCFLDDTEELLEEEFGSVGHL